MKRLRWLSLAVLLLLPGCQTGPGRAGLERQVLATNSSTVVVRIAGNNFGERFARRVEEASDVTLAGTSDPVIRRRALLWKLHAIPACFMAQDHPSPVSSLADLAALCIQMHNFFRDGQGKDLFGVNQAPGRHHRPRPRGGHPPASRDPVASGPVRGADIPPEEVGGRVSPQQPVLQSHLGGPGDRLPPL